MRTRSCSVFAYAYERAAQIRRTPSEINPQTWHCVAPVVYLTRTCGPGETAPDVTDSVSVPAPVGGAVPATLSLTLGTPATSAPSRRAHAGVHGEHNGQRDQHGG